MVEIQSCANLAKDSSLCSIEQEVKEDNVNVNVVIAEISGELKRERQKNAELMEKISVLEAQIQEREKGILLSNGQGSCPDAKERCLKKFKRQKTEPISEKIEDVNLENRLVNWMSMDDTQNFHSEKFKESDAFCETDESDDEDDDCFDENENEIDHKDKENCDNVQAPNELKELLVGLDEEINVSCLEGGPAILVERSNEDIKKDSLPPYTNLRQCGSISMQKKPPKMAFCPKEIKKIIELEELLLKNAQSHTIRKILVFASLGIRHGLEDMYELDFNHFSILQQGEQYVSPKNPGEHVLYENPGVRRKVFYPNRQNPTLCPVQILEEEKTMRPWDASCPPCLFLCIKYGGRTRNLPQNEYVRQRMGNNKLKSFGPVICGMAMLVHIRSGSFFFKALGITLLFMAGFSDDLVQKETKYRNLDLLQKYYRTDEDAEGEELFLLHPLPCVTASPTSQQLNLKTVSTKSKGKKHNSSTTKPHNSQTPPSRPAPPTQFGLMGYNSIQTHAMSAFQSMPPPTPVDPTPLSNRPVTHPGPTIPFRNQYPYPIFPPNPTNNFVPMMYWPPPNAFYPSPYPSSYDYRYFPSAGNYVSVHPHPYYRNTSGNLLIPEMVEASAETADDSNSSSSTTGPKEDE